MLYMKNFLEGEINFSVKSAFSRKLWRRLLQPPRNNYVLPVWHISVQSIPVNQSKNEKRRQYILHRTIHLHANIKYFLWKKSPCRLRWKKSEPHLCTEVEEHRVKQKTSCSLNACSESNNKDPQKNPKDDRTLLFLLLTLKRDFLAALQ